MDTLSASPIDTKRHLLLTAMDAFGENGIEATSIRAITQMAEARNSSAIYYHFQSKSGLIKALIYFIQGWYDNAREPLLKELESRGTTGPEGLRSLLQAVASPYVQLLKTEKWGYSAIRFLARIEYECPQDASDIVNRGSQASVKRLVRILKKCMPDVPRKQLLMRFNFFLNSLIQGLASYKHLDKSYFGNLSGKSFAKLAEFYIDCGERVILAPIDKC